MPSVTSISSRHSILLLLLYFYYQYFDNIHHYYGRRRRFKMATRKEDDERHVVSKKRKILCRWTRHSTLDYKYRVVFSTACFWLRLSCSDGVKWWTWFYHLQYMLQTFGGLFFPSTKIMVFDPYIWCILNVFWGISMCRYIFIISSKFIIIITDNEWI